jgi:uncharacterized membrane protein YgcG
MMVSRRSWFMAVALVAGGILSFASASAFAAGTLRVNVANGLTQAQVVRVSGTGLTANAFGYVLECNGAPGEPTVGVGAPFNQRIPVGCSRPSLKSIVSTASDGSLSTTFKVHESRNLGPPCSVYSVFGPCGGHPDSAGKGPRADAQNYPCPPSPDQQAAGVKCSLVFYDTAHEVVSTPITFSGVGPPIKTPPTTAPVTPPTTAPVTPPTTAPGTTPTTAALTRSTGGSGSSSTGSGSSSTGSGSPSTGSGSSTAPGVVRATSGSLAFTGLGATGKLLAVLGAILVVIGLVLLFVNVRKVGLWFLGY